MAIQYLNGINVSGSVGIGTDSPEVNRVLDVNGNMAVRSNIYVAPAIGETSNSAYSIEIGQGRTGNGYAFLDFVTDDTYTDHGLRIIRGNTGANTFSEIKHRGTGLFKFAAQEAANMTFSTSNSERMRIASNGNVGIGTTSPSTSLHIKGTSAGGGYLTIENTVHSSKLLLKSTTQTGSVIMDSTGGYVSGGGLVFDSGSNIRTQFLQGGSTKMIINNGNVGIGTTSPNRKLSVYQNSSSLVADFRSASGNNSYISLSNNASTADQVKIGAASGDLVLMTSYNERMRINSSGNVGIGTTSPDTKLRVNGVVKATSVRVGSSNNIELFDYSNSLHIYSTSGSQINLGGGIGNRQNDVNVGNGNLTVNGSARVANDSDAASASKAGALRYRTSGNNSYVDMCMQTGATTYAWVNIVQNNW